MVDAIELKGATVIRGDETILQGINLRLRSGEHACILGPNGSGKSTIVKLISGELSPLYREPAAITLFGQERWSLFELRSRLGIVSDSLQAVQASEECVLDTIVSGFYGSLGIPMRTEPPEEMIEKAKAAAESMGVRHLLGRRASCLSSGQMRRVLVARALVHEPEMLLLDEPYNSLDIGARHSFGACVRELARKGHAIVLVTHELAEIPQEIERVVLVKDGRILADGDKGEVLRSELVSELFGLKLRVQEEGGLYRAYA
jgi:ABC-type molybdenum transport system, ATPase component/photorepair protein PhrA